MTGSPSPKPVGLARRTILSMLGSALVVPTDGSAADLEPPFGGVADGDVTMTAFFDYNCPFCKAASPEVQRFVAADARVRLIYKDWPILGEASAVGARLALAASYQGRYEAAHLALMALKGRRSDGETMRRTVRGCGLDAARLDDDAARHATEIAALLARNAADAAALGWRAVPTFTIGGLKVVGGFDVENFQIFAAQARQG